MAVRPERRLLLSSLILLGAVLAVHLARVVLTPPPPPLPDADPVASYAVDYIERNVAAGETVNTLKLDIRRPFDGSMTTFRGPPPGGEETARLVHNIEFAWTVSNEGPVRYLRRPAGPPNDVSFAVLVAASQAELVEYVGTRTILGRTCYRFLSGSSSGEVLRPVDIDEVETCVTPGGIVLYSSWASGGRTARITEAIAVDHREVDDRSFRIGDEPVTDTESATTFGSILGTQLQVRDIDFEHDLVVDATVPERYELARRAEVAESRGRGDRPAGAVVEAYVDGLDLLLVERSLGSGLRALWEAGEGSEVELDVPGEAEVVYLIDRVEVRVIGEWGYARVTALSLDDAMEVARTLDLTDPDAVSS